MKLYKTCSIGGALLLTSHVAFSQAFVREVKLASMASAKVDWVSSDHDVPEFDANSVNVFGDFDSAYEVGSGLWFGLYAPNGDTGELELVATRVVGAQPEAEITIVSLDTYSNDSSHEGISEPITRADMPFSASLLISNISDDALLNLGIEELDGFSTFVPAAKYMKVKLFTEDSNGDNVVNGLEPVYTFGSGNLVLKPEDTGSAESELYLADGVTTHLPNVDGWSGTSGREVIQTYTLADTNLTQDEIDNGSIADFTFTESTSAGITILPVAKADKPVDDTGALIDGKQYNTVPSIVWNAKNLYPRSITRIALFLDGVELTDQSGAYSNDKVSEVQDHNFIWGKESIEPFLTRENVTYTAKLLTKTIYTDSNGDGVGDAWELIDSVDFFYNRELNINSNVSSRE